MILSTFLDYSFNHIVLSIWSSISLWVLVGKSHHVKLSTVALTIRILSWSYAKLIHFIFLLFLKLGLLYLYYFYTYSYNKQFIEGICVFYCWECMAWEFWIEVVSCCYGMHKSWYWGVYNFIIITLESLVCIALTVL